MNLPEDPTSIPFGEGERPIPPVEGAWSQMERKLDVSMPLSPSGAGSGAAPQGAIRLPGSRNVLRPWYGRIGIWAGVGVAAIIAIVVTRLVFPPGQSHMAAAPPAAGSQEQHTRDGLGGAVADNNRGGAGHGGQGASAGHGGRPDRVSGVGGVGRVGGAGGGAGGAGQPAGRIRSLRGISGGGANSGAGANGNVDANSTGGTNATVGAAPGKMGNARVGGSREAGGDGIRGRGFDGSARTGITATVPGIRHSPGAVARVFAGSLGTSPVKAADSLLRLTAAKHVRGTVVLAGSHSGSRFRRIPQFSAGIALKQYVPLPGQQFNDYSAGGGRQVYSDYIPAVFFRAAIDSRSYLQLSFGFNSPQYTRDMVIDNTNVQNSTVTGYTAYLEFERDRLKKLFYNELDLTYHYQIADRWRAGVGIQYARLYGGTVESQTILQPANPALTDTVYASHLVGMKKPSGYYQLANQRSEWRGIVEIEYCWTRWMLGMRYQQAFDSFDFVINSSAGQHVTNGALSIRASYALWERNRP